MFDLDYYRPNNFDGFTHPSERFVIISIHIIDLDDNHPHYSNGSTDPGERIAIISIHMLQAKCIISHCVQCLVIVHIH